METSHYGIFRWKNFPFHPRNVVLGKRKVLKWKIIEIKAWSRESAKCNKIFLCENKLQHHRTFTGNRREVLRANAGDSNGKSINQRFISHTQICECLRPDFFFVLLSFCFSFLIFANGKYKSFIVADAWKSRKVK